MKLLIFLSLMFSTQVFAKSNCIEDMSPKYIVQANYHSVIQSGRQPMNFSKDGKYLIAQTSEEVVRLLNAEDGSLVRNFVTGGLIIGVQISNDNKLLAVTTNEGPVEVFDVDSGQSIYRSKAKNRYVSQVAFTSDSRYAVSPGIVIDLEKKEEHLFAGRGLVAISSDNKYFVSTDPWKGTMVVNLNTMQEILSFGEDEEIQSAGFNAQGTHLYLVRYEGQIEEIELENKTRKTIEKFYIKNDVANFVNGRSEVLLRLHDNRTQYVVHYDLENKQELLRYEFGGNDLGFGAFTFSALHPSMRYIVALGEGSSNGRAQIVNAQDGTLDTILNYLEYGQSVEFHPSGNLLAFAMKDNSQIWVYDTSCMQ